MKTCTKCGQENSDNAKRCSVCACSTWATMSEEERIFNLFLKRSLGLKISTRFEGEHVIAELPELGITARGVSEQGTKQRVVKDAIAEFERMNKAILMKQYAERDEEDGLYVWQEGQMRMMIVRDLLAQNLTHTRKKLVLKRPRRAVRNKVLRKGLRSVSASFKERCMGRDIFPF